MNKGKRGGMGEHINSIDMSKPGDCHNVINIHVSTKIITEKVIYIENAHTFTWMMFT